MRLETVAESFATYRAKVLPPDAPAIQVVECQRAFYAGVYFCLMNLAYNIGDDSTSEDQGVVELEKLKAECEAYAGGVGMPLPRATPPPVVEPPNYTTPDAGEMRPVLQALGARIGADLPEGWGFNLLLFTYGEGGSLFYISSAERQDVIAIMREVHQPEHAMSPRDEESVFDRAHRLEHERAQAAASELTADDRARLLAIAATDDDRTRARGIRDYWHDGDRADRTPRTLAYYHLGLLSGIIDRLLDERT